MNTTPADEKLALWLEDELDGPALAEIDAWAASNPEWLQHRAAARDVKALIRPVFPAAEEPPYAEFFNARISREIETSRAAESATPEAAPAVRSPIWHWFLPATAVAGMALCFWAGTRIAPPGQAGMADTRPTQASPPQPLSPVLYTPEKGVKAAYYSSTQSDAMVIVLDGVAALPDSFELPETADGAREDEGSATADNLLPAP